jgi:hypothetical protein
VSLLVQNHEKFSLQTQGVPMQKSSTLLQMENCPSLEDRRSFVLRLIR